MKSICNFLHESLKRAIHLLSLTLGRQVRPIIIIKSKTSSINDLKYLLVLVSCGKKGYQLAAEATDDPELKAIFKAFR
jgi:hypothetical protein